MYTMLIQSTKLQAKIAGKISTYTLNAYTDAQIAVELKNYLLSGKITGSASTPKLRAQHFLAKPISKSYLIGLIFTQHQLNGLMDYMYARLFSSLPSSSRFSPFRSTLKIHLQQMMSAYQNPSLDLASIFPSRFCLTKPWLGIFIGNFQSVYRYAKEQLQYQRRLSHSDIIKAIIHVQSVNIVQNSIAARMLQSSQISPDPKITALKHMSTLFHHQSEFLQSATQTFNSASRWDAWFSSLLKFRYSKLK